MTLYTNALANDWNCQSDAKFFFNYLRNQTALFLFCIPAAIILYNHRQNPL